MRGSLGTRQKKVSAGPAGGGASVSLWVNRILNRRKQSWFKKKEEEEEEVAAAIWGEKNLSVKAEVKLELRSAWSEGQPRSSGPHGLQGGSCR